MFRPVLLEILNKVFPELMVAGVSGLSGSQVTHTEVMEVRGGSEVEKDSASESKEKGSPSKKAEGSKADKKEAKGSKAGKQGHAGAGPLALVWCSSQGFPPRRATGTSRGVLQTDGVGLGWEPPPPARGALSSPKGGGQAPSESVIRK